MLSWYQISLSATCVFTAFFFLGKILGALIILVAWIAQIFCFGTSYMAASPQVGIYCDTVTSDMTYSNIFIMIKYYMIHVIVSIPNLEIHEIFSPEIFSQAFFAQVEAETINRFLLGSCLVRISTFIVLLLIPSHPSTGVDLKFTYLLG